MAFSEFTKQFKAPALPLPPLTYSKKYNDALNSVLRLYFNQIDLAIREIMADTGPYGIYAAGVAKDAFGRMRVSHPFTLFDSQSRYNASDEFNTALTGSASTNYLVNESALELIVTTASGDEVIRESNRVLPYLPGKSMLLMMTFAFDAQQTDLRQRAGLFSTQNGIFIEQDDTAINMVLRSFVSGSAVDTVVAQDDWNGDRLDGRGLSEQTLDLTKSQIFYMDLEWLGVGSVRCGFIIDGDLIICHTFHNANAVASVYMTTAILPVRMEITAKDTIGAQATAKQICSTVFCEGVYERKVPALAARQTANTTVTTTLTPLVSIRLASDSLDAVVIPYKVPVIPTGAADYEVVLIKNATLTGASYDTSTFTHVDYDITATSYTGGTIVGSAFINGTSTEEIDLGHKDTYNFSMQLGRTLGGVSDIYTLAARTIVGSDTIIGSIEFLDLT